MLNVIMIILYFSKQRINPNILDIKQLNILNKVYYFVTFSSFETVKMIYEFVNNNYKLKHDTCKNFRGENIELFYAFDLQDYESSFYYNVVLRNFPEDFTANDIKRYCEQISSGILYVVGPKKIKNSVCAYLIYNSLDQAELLCSEIKKRENSKIIFNHIQNI